MPESAKNLREVGLVAITRNRDVRKQFDRDTRFVTAHVEEILRRKSISIGGWKILVEVRPEILDRRVRNHLGVLVVEQGGDFESFLRLTDYEKKLQCLDWLTVGFHKIAELKQFDVDLFDAAIAEVRDCQGRFERLWIKPKERGDLEATAELSVAYGVGKVEIIVRLRDSRGRTIREKVVGTESASEFIFSPLLGDIEWCGDSLVRVKDKNGNVWSEVSADI